MMSPAAPGAFGIGTVLLRGSNDDGRVVEELIEN